MPRSIAYWQSSWARVASGCTADKQRSKPAVPIAAVSLNRCAAEQLHQFRHPPHRGADTVQLGLPAPAYHPDLQLRRFPPRLGANPGASKPCAAQTVPGHADAVRKQLFENQSHPRQLRAHPSRRSPVPDGLRRMGTSTGIPGLTSPCGTAGTGGEASRFGLLKRDSMGGSGVCRKTARPGGAGQFVSRTTGNAISRLDGDLYVNTRC